MHPFAIRWCLVSFIARHHAERFWPGVYFPKAGMDSTAVRRRPGRPRSEQADQAILAAALDLFAECGPDALCIEQVAVKAGVGKATIYRRWPGKEEMLVDALGGLGTHLPVPQGRSVRADLVALLDAIRREAADPRRARLFALLQGEGVRY